MYQSYQKARHAGRCGGETGLGLSFAFGLGLGCHLRLHYLHGRGTGVGQQLSQLAWEGGLGSTVAFWVARITWKTATGGFGAR